MSLEWFDRVCSELQDYLESICEDYDEIGQMRVERAAKHPRIEFFIVNEDDEQEREDFCTIQFDPQNEEFYIEEYDFASDDTFRKLLPDIENIIENVHEAFHDYIDEEELEMDHTDDEIHINEDIFDDDEETPIVSEGGDYDVIVDVEWTTPEVLAYSYLDEVEVTYQFGVITETGDGILHRVNRIFTEDQGEIEDESNFIFSKEEASTIIELIESNLDHLEGFDSN